MEKYNRLPEGNFTYHTNCTACGSSDANAVYDNGTSYCFSCGRWSKETSEKRTNVSSKVHSKMSKLPDNIEYKDLIKRKVSKETCRKYGYGYVETSGGTYQAATYYNEDNEVCSMKIRYPNKEFKWIGKAKEATLFGMQLFSSGGKYITITEGEIDALSVAEAFDCKYPVVSIPNGADAAKKSISKNIEFINSFEKIILWFDNDEVGRNALASVIQLFQAGKVKVIQHPKYKDANELLVSEGKAGVVQAFYNAKDYRPDGIVTVEELEDLVAKPVEFGLDWCFEGLTKLTYGRRLGELHLLGAGVSIGKTDLLMNQIAYDITHGIKCGTFMLEQNVVETLKRIAGKLDGVHYHLPLDEKIQYDVEKLKETVKKIKETDNLYMYNNFGSMDWDVIKEKIRVMAHTYGVQCFYIDNMTALTAHASDERRFIDGFMEEAATLAQELNIWILVVSHLNPPKKGASHEEGGKVLPNQFTGSRAIMRWAHYMMGLERNAQHTDEAERSKVVFRFIKDRYAGSATGKTISLRYDTTTGLLREVDEEFTSVEPEDYDDDRGDY